MTLSTTTQLELHRMMMLIRLFEEALEEIDELDAEVRKNREGR